MGWQSMGEIGEALDQQRRPAVVAGSDEQRRGEVGDLIWSPVKEETRQGGFTTAMCVLGGGGGPPVAGQSSGGGHQFRGRGAAVSSSGGHYSKGGLGGRSERSVRVVALGGQGSAMVSMKRRT
jgi:hypothetical protein